MKIALKEQPEQFQPITVEITIESLEEFVHLRTMSAYDCTIPDAVTKAEFVHPDASGPLHNTIKAFLVKLNSVLFSIKG